MSNYRFLAFLVLTAITMFAIYLPQPLTPNFFAESAGTFPINDRHPWCMGSLGNAIAMLAFGNLNAFTGFLVGQLWVLIFTLSISREIPRSGLDLGYFFMGGYRLCRSMVLAVSRSLVHPGQTGMAFGMIETANSVAVITAPVLAGYCTVKHLIPCTPFLVWLICAVILLNLLILYTIKRKNNNKHGVFKLRSFVLVHCKTT
jgi:hypothetical protein